VLVNVSVCGGGGCSFFVLKSVSIFSSSSISICFDHFSSVAPDIQVGMDEGQHWQIVRFDFEGCDFHARSYFIFLP
jgi:hypothetical protein